MTPIEFTILGQAASKNRRRIVANRATGKLSSIKSREAMVYFHSAALQVPNLAQPFDVPVKVTIHLYYTTERPDLEESVLLDAMQSTSIGSGKAKRYVRNAVYRNDRLVREKHIIHHIDAENPRAEVRVEVLPSQSHFGIGTTAMPGYIAEQKALNARSRSLVDKMTAHGKLKEG